MLSCSIMSDSLWPHGLYPNQVPPSMGFSRQRYWSGLPFPPPRDLPNPGVEPMALAYPVLAGRFFTSGTTLLLLSRFSRVRLCATPETAAHQAPPSLGFSRQEHWSGLPFPSLMHETENWKWSHSIVSDSSRAPGLQPTRLLRPWDFPGESTGVGCHCITLVLFNSRTHPKDFEKKTKP